MDFVPTQDVAYEPHDELTVVCHHDVHIRLVYRDWTGAEQERTVGRGTWPCKSTMILGYKVMDNTTDPTGWGARQDIDSIGNGIEFSVGKSLEQELPKQMRRAR